MRETIAAVYVDGTLKLEHPLEGLENHSKVQVIVLAQPGVSNHPLEKCIGTMSDEDAEEMKRIMTAEFDQVDPDDWNGRRNQREQSLRRDPESLFTALDELPPMTDEVARKMRWDIAEARAEDGLASIAYFIKFAAEHRR